MRKILSIVTVAAALGVVVAQGGRQTPGEGESRVVDLKADVVYPIQWRDTTAFCLVGNFAAHHNGAIITCDSAVRYSDKHIECFGNVLINKNTTYVYGDRADYNGEINEARVYSDIVKVVDGDATLYTYRFAFNTLDNIGTFAGGGVVMNRDNTLESMRGYYYADTREVICVDEVEMRNDTYRMKGDSVVYNLATDHAQYFDDTNIWNDRGEYLHADRGTYDKPQELYSITRNGYILTEKQEVWSDSLDYYRADGHAVLRRDIQIDDTEYKALAFGDYGEYWKTPGNVLLTRRPSVISYDPEQGDSLFMRADTVFMYTINILEEQRRAADSAARAAAVAPPVSASPGDGEALQPDSLGVRPERDSMSRRGSGLRSRDGRKGEMPGGLPAPADSLASATAAAAAPAQNVEEDLSAAEESSAGEAAETEGETPVEELTPEERKARLREQAEKERAEKRAAAEAKRKARDEEIIAKRRAKALAQKERDEAQLAKRRAKAEAKLQQRRERAARKGKRFAADSAELQKLDSLLDENRHVQDSLHRELGDSVARDTVARDSVVRDSLAADTLSGDSIRRIVRAYRNVKMYRTDFQSVCDSLVAFSSDSTIHLYIDPVLWNETNQITSDVMDLYVANGELSRGEFVGKPLMVSELDTMYYNQVTGKEMTALFRDNRIYRNDVNGNAQTIYYMQESGSPEVIGLMVIESGSMTFYIEDRVIDGITYRGNPVYTIYPMDKIPETQELFLKDFKWEGKRRPTQAEVFDRRLRPSERGEKSRLPQPQFPILQRIEAYKSRLIESGRWLDRDDGLAPEAAEWMNSLGN